MRRFYTIALILCFGFMLSACDSNSSEGAVSADGNGDTVKVVTTIFPVYDFVREVGGEYVSVTKLLPSGVESHSFEPSPSDIITIHEADLFLYTGDTMEPWVPKVIQDIDSVVGDVSQNVPLLRLEKEEDEGDEEHYDYDPHIWTDPTRAMIMVDNIAEYLTECDPDHGEKYRVKAAAYKEELAALDEHIQEIVANGKRDKIIFGGRFAFLYFTDHYQLKYDSAVDSCSEHSEPSVKKIAEMITEIEEEGIPVIYYEELSNPTVSESIANDTGISMLLLHSCHNVTEEELNQGVTYLSLMYQNAENMKKGLN